MTARILKMNEREYHDGAGESVPLCSYSIGKILATESPLHAWAAHPKLGGMRAESSAAMDEGSVIDALLSGANDAIEVAETEWPDFKTKAAQEWRDAVIAQGKVPLLPIKFARYRIVADKIRQRLIDAGCDLSGVWQPSILFELPASNGNAVKCKARLDHLAPVTGLVTDVKKVARSAKPDRKLAAHITQYGYDIQAALYPLAVEQVMPDLVGRSRFEWAFVEPSPPYAVARVEPSGTMRALGLSRLQYAIDVWERCLRTGEWPGYEGVARIEAAPWMLEEMRIEEVTEDGYANV